jgi:tetratricopeptide (TPR) repeat protein
MPQIVKAESRRNGSRMALLVLGAVLVLLVLGWALKATLDWESYSSVWTQADKLDGSKDLIAEAKLLEDYTAGQPPSGYRYSALVRLGDLYYNMHNYGKAFVAYEHAHSLTSRPSAELELGIANTATQLHDYGTAAAAYKYLITLTPKSNYEQIGEYQDQIRYLENR